jgi:hypothetical protein
MARSEKWLVYLKTGVSGPHDQAGLRELYRRGELTAATRIKPANGQRWLIVSQVPEVWQPLKATGATAEQKTTSQPKERFRGSKVTATSPPNNSRPAKQLKDSDELFTFDDPLAGSPGHSPASVSCSENRPERGEPKAEGAREVPANRSGPPGSFADPLSPPPPSLDPLRHAFISLASGNYLNGDEDVDRETEFHPVGSASNYVKPGFWELPSEPSRRAIAILLVVLLGPVLLAWLLMFLVMFLDYLIKLFEPAEDAQSRVTPAVKSVLLLALGGDGSI